MALGDQLPGTHCSLDGQEAVPIQPFNSQTSRSLLGRLGCPYHCLTLMWSSPTKGTWHKTGQNCSTQQRIWPTDVVSLHSSGNVDSCWACLVGLGRPVPHFRRRCCLFFHTVQETASVSLVEQDVGSHCQESATALLHRLAYLREQIADVVEAIPERCGYSCCAGGDDMTSPFPDVPFTSAIVSGPRNPGHQGHQGKPRQGPTKTVGKKSVRSAVRS